MAKSVLRDGSTIVRYTRLELSRSPKTATIVFADAVTTKGEKVIVSCGCGNDRIGRAEDKDYPASDFHLLDGRYQFPYWCLDNDMATVAAIDEDGEVWILCSWKAYTYANFCPVDLWEG